MSGGNHGKMGKQRKKDRRKNANGRKLCLEIGKNLFWGCSKRFEAMHNAISSAWTEDFESLGFWSWCHGKNVCICLPTLVEVEEFAHQKRNVAFLSTVPVGGMVCVGD